ncbi:kinesin-like protein KIF24 isoform X2 [Erythrolamprus reginae]|uniref:kinesin-like protein KIF24 isoform X2 n=1 Tax=Erythrolamprus reginae TaxID=121349 RepID=UPI00396C9EC2
MGPTAASRKDASKFRHPGFLLPEPLNFGSLRKQAATSKRMASCLYECLCEAELQKYYPHFTALGFEKIDELAKVSMKDYSKLGVHNMKDRKRLFQLIRIIKMLQAEDEAVRKKREDSQKSSRRLRPQLTRSGPRRQLHFESEGKEEQKEFESGPCAFSHGSSAEEGKEEEAASGFSHDSVHKRPRKESFKVSASWTEEDQPVVPAPGSSNDVLGDTDVSFVQRVAHISGYNYGVPRSYTRVTAGEKETPWIETDKIRVCVRKRPLGLREERRGEVNILTVEDKETLLLHEKKEAVDLTQYILQHVFYFDEVFGESCSNQDVYMKTAHPLIQHVFSGGNATCFAYGQTGAGKTYTMFGTPKAPGLYALAAKEIFKQLETTPARKDLHVWISFYEIYCGQLYDLLSGRKRLYAREDSKHVVQIVGLREVHVNTVNLLLEVILKGGKERSTGATGVNSDSSRSHAIIQIQMKDPANRVFGRISFIDLAGSERAADAKDSDRQTKMEGAEINQSLLALKECIRALDQEHTHTPFRQSKLTQVLKDSFVGNSKTCMIANVSPSHVATEHTLNTLRYADRVKELKRGMKSCTPVASRPRATGQTSPKRLQHSPYLQVGGKSSPKKVKLGLPHPLMLTPLMSKLKTSSLFPPAHLPFSSTPKGQGRKEPLGAPWPSGCPSAEQGMPKADSSSKNLAEGPVETSEKSQLRKDSVARREGGPEDRQRAKVEAVQKQLVPRADFSHHGSDGLPDREEDPGRVFADRCVAAWTDASSRQKDREQHLRLYHEQFQQPPLLQQKLNYQPLEKFLARYKSQEVQVRPEAPCPDSVSPQCRDETMQLEELDDSDFSEDSFTAGPGRKMTDREAGKQSSQNSFFLHRRDFGARERDGEDERELLCKWYAFEKEGRASPSAEESSSYEDSGRSLGDWSSGEISAVGSFPHRGIPEKPYCSKEDGRNSQGWPIEQKTPRSLDPSHGFPDPHCSPPRKRTPSPSLAAILLEPPFFERTGLSKERDFRGALDFPMDLADDSGTPLSVSFLNWRSTENQGKKETDEKVLGLRRHREEDVHESRPPAASSIYEINHWGRRSELGLSPGSKFQWLPRSCRCPADAAILETASAFSDCVCGYPGEDPLAELFPGCADRASLSGNLRTSEYATIYDSDPEVGKIGVSWRYSAHLGLGGKETPVLLAPSSPGDKGGLASPPDALSGSDEAGDQPVPERSPPAQSELPHRTLELQNLEEACRKEGSQNIHHCEETEQEAGAEPQGTVVKTTKNWRKVDVAEDALKEKDALGRQLVLRTHQEQLDEMAALSSQEESLMGMMSDLEFEDCLTKLDEILSLKAECIHRARSQLQLCFAAPSSGTTTLLPVSST